ncbi:hypothetical protein [Nitrosomonas oligotropha]|uniref:Uncharacterized protein n=1 Tax=Nitrosomonas oligotropha TaxID=42354 RepID=A0A1H8RI59_9PROT|nr:hypothetical protein [Nitrosomonas oligotropha]SDW92447.1 hypothetical protein SAMN05216300_11349 [Nitrosomonas oligotropha]SEO65834.1 hypothetical protein SAMN05216333_11449 [Nitrosomonas oligotropha]
MDEAIRLDHDTADIPGTPDIANTIFSKIRETGVFVADLTLLSQASTGKKSPNPNVLVELGYAFSAINDSKVISVMNTAFGQPSDLPFDLSHKRWPIQYCLLESEAEDKTKVSDIKKTLTDQLYTAIRLVLEATPQMSSTPPKLTGAPSLSYIEHIIQDCDPQEEWEKVSTEISSIAVNKRDVNLRLVMNYLDEGKQCDDFQEDWANRHPDRHATGYWCDTYYGSTHVARNILVSVDGGRAMLPLPRQRGIDGKITEVLPFDYRIAQIFDSLGSLDEYMARSRLSLAFS